MRSPLSPARSSLRPAQVAHRRSRSPLSPARRSLGPARVAHGQSQCSLRHNLEAHGDNLEGFSGNLRSHGNRTRFSARAVAEPVLQDTDNGTLRVPIDSAAEPSVAWGMRRYAPCRDHTMIDVLNMPIILDRARYRQAVPQILRDVRRGSHERARGI